MEKEFRIRKIDLKSFIDILNDVYDKGVNFIDLYGSNDEDGDTIGLFFSKDYIDDEYLPDFEEYFTEEKTTLTDKDIKNLL
jgi:hypothetical protein